MDKEKKESMVSRLYDTPFEQKRRADRLARMKDLRNKHEFSSSEAYVAALNAIVSEDRIKARMRGLRELRER